MELAAAQIRTLAQTADKAGRQEILSTLNKLQSEIEDPMEMLMRLSNFNILIAMFRVAVHVQLFQALDKSESLDIDEIAKATGVTSELLTRILRYLASMNVIKENPNGRYTANNITRFFTNSRVQGQVLHGFETNIPVARELFDFLATTNYREITDNKHTPFQKAYNTNLHPFEWFAQNKKRFEHFHEGMAAMASAAWIDVVEVFQKAAEQIPHATPKADEVPFFVDVGGGYGHQSVLVGRLYPNLLHRIVFQDLPQTLDQVSVIEGIEAQAHDFFTPQPIKGAKFYYLRRVMHDWPDADALSILQHLTPSLSTDSRILIDEIVMPDQSAHWHSTMIDLSMMMAFAGKERCAQQWKDLAARSGLRVEGIHTYDAASYASVIVMVSTRQL
ncbi:uncharacterized protein BHQ10_002555 [Talaromyces amestolkiae]|uniref:Uncharacterized protein n=1 Tax=Talaromyces amestolkiae TaxID=1196081 RepID=A0A364KSM8_TALAM|nr:uncharacterized protein BHQ10_002555 [Talaromyces amestolkiae]RAO66543.1 hypothetical protein BHQ10_002555 [Talaromyces amestolkiae]